MKINIVENENNLKIKEKFILDENLSKLINICSNLNLSLNDYLFIRECFYLCDEKEYENHFNDFKILNEDSCNAKKIYTLFKEWKPYVTTIWDC